ncbi:hypothetical protein C8F01DRAFT_474340 [Mycena amicta]|nr:hypothetical protein C8F01DRAFT_474340 [Mycena amicta]
MATPADFHIWARWQCKFFFFAFSLNHSTAFPHCPTHGPIGVSLWIYPSAAGWSSQPAFYCLCIIQPSMTCFRTRRSTTAHGVALALKDVGSGEEGHGSGS